MKYEEQAGAENFKRFERLARSMFSVSSAEIKRKLSVEKSQKQKKPIR